MKSIAKSTTTVRPRGIRPGTPGGPVNEIAEWLRTKGNATAATMAEGLGMNVKTVTAACLRMSVALKYKPQRIHVEDYVHVEDGFQNYPRPLYAYGPGSNAKKPPPVDRKALKRKYYHESAKRTITSVFDLGLTVKERMQRAKKGNGCKNASDVHGASGSGQPRSGNGSRARRR